MGPPSGATAERKAAADPPDAGAATVSGTTSRTEWTRIGKGSNETIWVDVGSVKRIGDRLNVWTRRAYDTPEQAEGRTYRSAYLMWYAYCDEKKYASKAFTAFSGDQWNGEAVINATREDRDIEWSFAPPGSVAANIIDVACAAVAQ